MSTLAPQEGDTVCDATLGIGGHAVLILKRIGSTGKLIGIDADAKNLGDAQEILRDHNVELHHANFRDIKSFIRTDCDIIFADLGVSSPHFDESERGFSFRRDGPLDCRYDSSRGKTAADILNEEAEDELVSIFSGYGELQRTKTFVRAILNRRKKEAFRSTQDLVSVAESVYKWKAGSVLPQIFQALRIAVNEEMQALEDFLRDAPFLLKPGGRLGIISYHSLEDGMVKRRFKHLCTGETHPVTGETLRGSVFSSLTQKPIQPDVAEIEENSRARSARFRAIIRS